MKTLYIKNIIKLTAVVAVIIGIAACTKVNSSVGGALGFDTDLKITFFADKTINPDEKGVPSPVFIRMYQLKSPLSIEKADFIELYERDTAMLGDDFISKQELKRFAPGEERSENFVLNPDTRYVALYAEFFRYEDARYTVVFPVTKNNVLKNDVNIDITSNQILLAASKKR